MNPDQSCDHKGIIAQVGGVIQGFLRYRPTPAADVHRDAGLRPGFAAAGIDVHEHLTDRAAEGGGGHGWMARNTDPAPRRRGKGEVAGASAPAGKATPASSPARTQRRVTAMTDSPFDLYLGENILGGERAKARSGGRQPPARSPPRDHRAALPPFPPRPDRTGRQRLHRHG